MRIEGPYGRAKQRRKYDRAYYEANREIILQQHREAYRRKKRRTSERKEVPIAD